MCKYLITALLALVFAVPGAAGATFVQSTGEDVSLSAQAYQNPEMDPQLVEAILRAAADQSEYDYPTLNQMYEDGVVTIEPVSGGYQVSDGSGSVIMILDESI